ncbi:beta-ketoacyl synthase N-terminal-like domain-containing protein [Lewinella sp. W8]|uniref:beta-ketoacyl synthase N-terminal-like domain-containing protein n=1 Tax=Lewinella sp. W8 TaxID=2528208 RepID=UPI00156742FD|nr:beta-ketoacyl synthase N-terminal-like domain-containing protein [Lewinella sp. W8]
MRIHIHGRGSISAAGQHPVAAWETYLSGQPTWKKTPDASLPVYPVEPDPNAPAYRYAAERKHGRTAMLAIMAAEQAVREAGWEDQDFAILVGCSRGPTGEWEKHFTEFSATGRLETRTSPSTTLGSIGFALGEYFGNRSLASSLSVTCSSGMHALLHGIALLEAGMADRVLVGGAEAPLTAFTLQQMQALRIYATRPAAGQHACTPLAKTPSGMVIGEGAAFLALSRLPRHLPSGPNLSNTLPSITGLGFSRESGKTATGISPEGDGLLAAMKMATDGRHLPDLIIAHAPGTPKGDAAEIRAVRKLWKNVPGDPALTSLKWATGHTFGASGPLALDAAISMMVHQKAIYLPYPNYMNTPWALGAVMVNATGFGGNAVSVRLEMKP